MSNLVLRMTRMRIFFLLIGVLFSQALIENSLVLTRFAKMCQQSGIVPIVSPELLPEGGHGVYETRAVFREVLAVLVKIMIEHHVLLAVSGFTG